MIVDPSALVAIVVQEAGYERLVERLAADTTSGIGAPSLVELGLVLTARLGRDATSLVDRLLVEFAIDPIPFGERHWGEAVRAFTRYGRGRSPARLNFGDCLSYAVARLAQQPLLFVGDDFTHTDLVAA